MFRKIRRYIKDPYYSLGYDLIKKHPRWMSDKFYIKTLWRMCMGYELDLKHPITFNEKLQWLKLHDHNPLYPTLVDKVRVKDWVADKIGAEHIIPTLAVYKSVEEINLDKLPNQFVLKCNHDSGSVVICKDKNHFDFNEAKKKLDKALHHNFYWDAREWAYKKVKPLIFAEQYMEDTRTGELQDYKFFSFDGVAKALFIATERQGNEETKFDFFDMDFRHIDVTNGHPNADTLPSKPESFDEMVRMANELSKDFPEVRVDFYEVNGKSYFGELTFYHWGGMTPFQPNYFDKTMGEWIDLSKIDALRGGVLVKDNIVIYVHANEKGRNSYLMDYKFFCFNGEPKIMYVSCDKATHPTTDFFDMSYKRLPIRMKDENSKYPPVKPRQFDQMKEFASILSKDIPHVRVDFYIVDGQVKFGEMTFYHEAGLALVRPLEWNVSMGGYISINA